MASQWILHDQWLSEILHQECYRLVLDETISKELATPDSDAAKLLDQVQSKKVFLYAKIEPHATRTIHLIQERRFRLVDTNIVFERRDIVLRPEASPFDIRHAQPVDEQGVREIARSEFRYSRFHLDPLFTTKEAQTIKDEWVANFFRGRRGQHLVVALDKEQPVGFLLLLHSKEGIVTIDLIAVSGHHQRKGIAENMIAFAEASVRPCTGMLVGTQIANRSSIRLYEKLGFVMRGSQYVLHFHNTHVNAGLA